MTDTVKGAYIAFGKDVRIDDVQRIVDAIKMIKGVKSVKLNETDPDDYMNREIMKDELRDKFMDFYRENLK